MKKLALLSLGILLLITAPACSQDETKSQNATAPAASANATMSGHDMGGAMPANNSNGPMPMMNMQGGMHMANGTMPMANGTMPMMNMQGGMHMMGMTGMNMPMHMPMDMEGKYSDKLFLSMMIPHHSGAVAMCNEVLKNGKDPQVKAWAEEMNKAQQGEIVIMLKWLEDLGGKDKAAWDKMSEDMQAMHEHAMSADPDMNFVLMMIPHHAMALEMACPALLQSNDPKIVDLAKDIIVHQTEEIRAMRNWVDERNKPADAGATGEQQTQQQEQPQQP